MALIIKTLEADLQKQWLPSRALKLPGQGFRLNDLRLSPGVCGRKSERGHSQTEACGRVKDKSALAKTMTRRYKYVSHIQNINTQRPFQIAADGGEKPVRPDPHQDAIILRGEPWCEVKDLKPRSCGDAASFS